MNMPWTKMCCWTTFGCHLQPLLCIGFVSPHFQFHIKPALNKMFHYITIHVKGVACGENSQNSPDCTV